MFLHITAAVHAVFKVVEQFRNLRVAQRLSRRIRDEVLLRNIGYVFSFLIFGKQVIERLVFLWAHFRRNGKPPLLSITVLRIHIKDYAAKWKQPMPYNLA